MENLNDTFLFEQYRNILNRIDCHERIYYQMLVLYITVFGVVLGFSDKIPDSNILVPFILLSFLLFITLISNRHNQDQRLEIAYLIEIFEKKWKDQSFLKFKYNYKNDFDKKNPIRRFITHPIFVLFILTTIISVYFLQDIFTCIEVLSIIGLVVILILWGLVLCTYIILFKKDLNQYIIKIKEYKDKQ
ncbi:hypothetical protein HQ585_00620 [candidate division KSB1 bacterium]|nr:hypothetical protein [candidate division KSB1 bacterium]